MAPRNTNNPFQYCNRTNTWYAPFYYKILCSVSYLEISICRATFLGCTDTITEKKKKRNVSKRYRILCHAIYREIRYDIERTLSPQVSRSRNIVSAVGFSKYHATFSGCTAINIEKNLGISRYRIVHQTRYDVARSKQTFRAPSDRHGHDPSRYAR